MFILLLFDLYNYFSFPLEDIIIFHQVKFDVLQIENKTLIHYNSIENITIFKVVIVYSYID